MLFVHQSFVKEVSVSKRGPGVGGGAGLWKPLHGRGASPGEWSSIDEAAGGDAAWLDIHPLAECPINLRMQSIRQAAD